MYVITYLHVVTRKHMLYAYDYFCCCECLKEANHWDHDHLQTAYKLLKNCSSSSWAVWFKLLIANIASVGSFPERFLAKPMGTVQTAQKLLKLLVSGSCWTVPEQFNSFDFDAAKSWLVTRLGRRHIRRLTHRCKAYEGLDTRHLTRRFEAYKASNV